MGVAVVHLRSGSGCGFRSDVGVEKGALVSSTCRIQPLAFYRNEVEHDVLKLAWNIEKSRLSPHTEFSLPTGFAVPALRRRRVNIPDQNPVTRPESDSRPKPLAEIRAIRQKCEEYRNVKIGTSTRKIVPRRQFIKQLSFATASAGLLSQPIAVSGQENQRPITLALVGGAHIHTPNYIGRLKRRKEVKVKYVWDHDRARSEQRAKEIGCASVDDPHVIWSDAEVKGVVICSETNLHRELVLAAVEARKDLFVEKPLGMRAAESYAMAAAIENAHVLFATGYFMRTEPAHLFLKEQVARGSFGTITRVRASNCHNGSLGHWFDTDWRWMADPKIAGVGAFGDLGTHSLDILMWLLGDVDWVTADIKVVTGNYGDCDESGEALLKFKNGVTGTLAAGWVDVENPVTLLISGTEGHAVIFQNNLYFNSKHVLGADGSKPWHDLPARKPDPIDQFVDAVAGNGSMPLVTPHEAAARVSVMEAAYISASGSTRVKPA